MKRITTWATPGAASAQSSRGHTTGALASVALACLGATACTPNARSGDGSLETSIQPPKSRMVALADTTATVGPRREARLRTDVPAIAALPGETASSVRTRQYIDGARQDITLQGSALRGVGNGITVLVRTSRQPTLDESMPLFKPAEAGIRSEIGAQFPKVPMQVVDRSLSNSYGPYGLALGRGADNVRCLYMWQWIDANRLPSSADFTGPASVRVKMCRSDATFDEMAAQADHLTIGTSMAPAAQPTAAAAEPRIIVASADEPAAAAAASVETPPKRRAEHRRFAHHHARRASRVAKREVPDAGDETPAEESRTPVRASRQEAYQPQPASSASMSTANMSTANMSAAMGGDLPAQAYLGPKGASARPAPPR